MDGARLVIDEPTVLTQVVSQLNDLHLHRVDADTKGDLFEHVLRQIRQAGELGQFRTPRHVIRTLVRLVDPRLGETIYDPAAGTAGFLVGAWDHIRLANSSPAGIEEIDAEGKTIRRGLGDALSRDAVKQLQDATFYGADVDPQMVRLATMNLTLRGLDRVRILRRDALTRSLDRAAKAELGFPGRGFDVILANPPFSGRLDRDRIVEDVKVGRTAQTELLFLQYMLNHLRDGGRCGVVVPEGVLFGSTGAHRELRRKLVENNTVEAVLSLPGGVFNPYSGVKTSVLVFRKGGATGRVMYLHADNDGFKLDANHDQPIDEDDLPGLIEAFRDRGWSLAAMARQRPGRGLDRELVVRRSRRHPRSRLQPQRQSAPTAEPRQGRAPRSAGDPGRTPGDRDGDPGRDRRVGRGGAGSGGRMTAHAQVPLGEICKINPRTRRNGYASDTLVSFVRMAAVDERSGSITIREDRPIADVSKGYTQFLDGDVLFAKITPCMENGKAALARDLTNGMGSGSTEFYVLRPDEKVLGEYIYHLIRRPQFRETAKRNFTGTAGQQRVPKSFMENVLIPLPPLDEQRRIVGILKPGQRRSTGCGPERRL